MQAWLQQLKNKYHWSNKIKISKSSVFVCYGNLSQTRIAVNDNNNTCTVGRNTQLINVEVVITGEGNQLTIADDCHIENEIVHNKDNTVEEKITLTLQNKIDIKGKNNKVEIASGAAIYGTGILMRGNNNRLYIGGKGNCGINFQLMSDNNTIIIGDDNDILNAIMIACGGKSIIVGNGCMFADGADIRTTDHHPIFDSEGLRINPDQDVVIGDRVWLARQVDILKGSKIESDVVIGARAVVTGTIPANSIAVGVPVRVVHSGITWSK